MTTLQKDGGGNSTAPPTVLPTKPHNTFWWFTVNNPQNRTPKQIKTIKDTLQRAEWGVYTPEIAPSTGTPHWQGAMKHCSNTTQVCKIFGKGGLMKAYDTDQLYNYAAHEGSEKDKPRTGPTIHFGKYEREVFEFGVQGKRNDILACKKQIKEGMLWRELALEHDAHTLRQCREYYTAIQEDLAPEDRKVNVKWLCGPPGIGKGFLSKIGKKTYKLKVNKQKGGSIIYCQGYNHEKTLRIDDCIAKLDEEQLIELLDGDKLLLDIKYSHDWAHWNEVIICDNRTPEAVFAQESIPGRLLGRISECWNLAYDEDHEPYVIDRKQYERKEQKHLTWDDLLKHPITKRKIEYNIVPRKRQKIGCAVRETGLAGSLPIALEAKTSV